MSKQRYYYYVGTVDNEGRIELVTKIDYDTKFWGYNNSEKPLAMSKQVALDIVLGMNLNYTPAFLVTTLYELDSQLWRVKND